MDGDFVCSILKYVVQPFNLAFISFLFVITIFSHALSKHLAVFFSLEKPQQIQIRNLIAGFCWLIFSMFMVLHYYTSIYHHCCDIFEQ